MDLRKKRRSDGTNRYEGHRGRLDHTSRCHPGSDRFPRRRISPLREHGYRGDRPEHHQNGSQYDDEFTGRLRCGRCQPRPIHRGLGDRRRSRRRPLHRYLFDGEFPTAGEPSYPKSAYREAMKDSADAPPERGLSAVSRKYGPRFLEAWRRFDEENGRDPHLVLVDEVAHPQELLYAERLTDWVLRLNPEASEQLLLAARSQHICRWTIPRQTYEMTRVGYLRGRSDVKQFTAAKAAE